MKLFHGSRSTIEAIKGGGLFGGLFFAKSEESALSHGGKLHVVELDDAAVLTSYDMKYEIDYNAAVAAVRAELVDGVDDETVEAIFDVVQRDAEPSEEMFSSLRCDEDQAHASWEIQRLRGVVAKALGFKAVEMKDEHGTTYLVLPGVEVRVA